MPSIDFFAHRVRGGREGAWADFERMLALLVAAGGGDARLVFSNPGDWGIDVVDGDLNGPVTVYQAKYAERGIGASQQGQIRESFARLLASAQRKGLQVRRWVLCIPCSMDAPTTLWWDDWRARQQAESGVAIGLWDETELRRRLLAPAAQPVLRAYYLPDTPPSAAPLDAVPFIVDSGRGPGVEWQGGQERSFGNGDVYLLHDPPILRWAPDRSWLWQEAVADKIGGSERVVLRQVLALRRTPEAAAQVGGLRGQGTVLARLAGGAGVPRLAAVYELPDGTAVASRLPPGRSWRATFGDGGRTADRLSAAAAVQAAADVADTLAVLHAQGVQHRAITADGVVIAANGSGRLRDAGLAACPARPGEGPAEGRAPEQTLAGRGVVGPPTDTFRLAALVYRTLTGQAVPPTGALPVRMFLPELPDAVDALLVAALSADPAGRPADLAEVAAALRSARRTLSSGTTR